MLRPRVAIPTLRASNSSAISHYNQPDLSVAIADILPHEESLSVPAIVAQAIKEVLRERPPTPPPPTEVTNYTPFIMEPVFSGADTALESSDNSTVITPVRSGLHIKCDVVLVPSTNPVPVRLYLTGKEIDLPIIGQRCTIDVFCPKGYVKRLAVVKHDSQGNLYLEIQEKGTLWQTNHPTESIRFHLDNLFSLKSTTG